MPLLPDDKWRRDALCRGHDPRIFHPTLSGERYTKGVTDEDLEADVAKYWCSGCPVRNECLDDALVHGDQGVRGGTTFNERKAMVRARRGAAA